MQREQANKGPATGRTSSDVRTVIHTRACRHARGRWSKETHTHMSVKARPWQMGCGRWEWCGAEVAGVGRGRCMKRVEVRTDDIRNNEGTRGTPRISRSRAYGGKVEVRVTRFSPSAGQSCSSLALPRPFPLPISTVRRLLPSCISCCQRGVMRAGGVRGAGRS